jgi:hypothetical protein
MDSNCIYIYNKILDNCKYNKAKKKVAIDVLSKYVNNTDLQLKEILVALITNLKSDSPKYFK